MFPDHGHRWPLWGDVLHDELCLKPSDLHLSDDLTPELRSLYDCGEPQETSCGTTTTPTGWHSNGNLRVWELAAAEAKRRLADEVARYGVTLEQRSARTRPGLDSTQSAQDPTGPE